MADQRDKFRRNIFVTQLSQFDLPDYTAIPVVKDTADKLLLTGNSTLQHTLLLRKELEAEDIDAQLAAKRVEFKEKIASCSARHHDILVRQQAFREQTRDASTIIQDQNLKQRRALRRCEADAQERMKLEEDLTNLSSLASTELFRRHHLKIKLARYKKDADFLLDVVNSLPADYITQRDDPLQGLMDRHAHLVKTEKNLTSHALGLTEELKNANDALRNAEVDHTFALLELNGKLENFQEHHDQLKARNESLEAEAGFAHTAYKNRILFAGNALRAVDSLVERCGGTAPVMQRGRERVLELKNRSFEKKLERNRNFFSQQSQRGEKSHSTAYEAMELDVLLSGIHVITQRQKDIAEEATKRVRAPREVAFAKSSRT